MISAYYKRAFVTIARGYIKPYTVRKVYVPNVFLYLFRFVCSRVFMLSVADMGFACGRYGIGCGRCGLWPISSVADMVVADMVCGRYRRNSNHLGM